MLHLTSFKLINCEWQASPVVLVQPCANASKITAASSLLSPVPANTNHEMLMRCSTSASDIVADINSPEAHLRSLLKNISWEDMILVPFGRTRIHLSHGELFGCFTKGYSVFGQTKRAHCINQAFILGTFG